MLRSTTRQRSSAPDDSSYVELVIPDTTETLDSNTTTSRMPLGRAFRSWTTRLLLVAIGVLGTYLLAFEGRGRINLDYEELDLAGIDIAIEQAKIPKIVTYQPPDAESMAKGAEDKADTADDGVHVRKKNISRTLKYHKIWSFANAVINIHEMFPDTPDVEVVLDAMRTAQIVNVDKFDMKDEESGTSEKWLLHLEGGQKAVMKIEWETAKGKMKKNALCNYGYEMPHGEIAAFHLHRLLGFRNTPYVTGRRVDLKNEIFPVSSPAVASQISFRSGNRTCVTGKCYYCEEPTTICPEDGIVEASIAYWVPRRLNLYTHPPKYMPWSTPRGEEWKHIRFNNKTYCEATRKIHPYDNDRYYHDLFDFAVVDTLMYHYDSKHYLIFDNSDAHGLTIRLDHGRAFCASDRDDEHIFMAPITQCCMLRWATYDALLSMRDGLLSKKLREELSRDPLFPLLDEQFYPALDRRHRKLIDMIEMCGQHNGGIEKILVG